MPPEERETPDFVLRPGRIRWLAYFIIGLGFTVSGGLMIGVGDWWGWFVAGFFGLCMVVSAVLILPGASYLRLTAEGFTVCTLYQRQGFKWAEVGPCFTGVVAGRKRVLFQFTDPTRSSRFQGVVRAIWGAEGTLPDTYGMTAAALATLMNDWRENLRSAQ